MNPSTESREISLAGTWKAQQQGKVSAGGAAITAPGFSFAGWPDATVPGTVLGALVADGVYPDPFFGTQNESIPDASAQPEGFYTYWFATAFELSAADAAGGVWLDFRGINYTAQVFLNGQQVGTDLSGMFLRHSLHVSAVAAAGTNRLAVLVAPPWPPGTPGGNGGQPGTPNIGESVTMRYTIGWDWVQPVRDRNCGIWDRVAVRLTGPVRLDDPHVVTTVLDSSGRLSGSATVALSAELFNPGAAAVRGTLTATLSDGAGSVQAVVTLAAGERKLVALPDVTVASPRLWWPNGLGGDGLRELYTADFDLSIDGAVSDQRNVTFGMRQVSHRVETVGLGQGFVLSVNGRDVFLRGGNWIGTDSLLRAENLCAERYESEVALHAAARLNLLRVWGGGIAERPEFYAACDRHGLLVMQDFWISSEFTGPFPSGWQETFLACARDTIKLLRNHPSLAFWSGGNETPPPQQVGDCLRCYVTGTDSSGKTCSSAPSSPCGAGVLDGTRPYVAWSTSGADGLGPGDGPYGILNPADFFRLTTCPLNPEVGSVGTPTATSVRRMMPAAASYDFPRGSTANTTWQYHTYIPYSNPGQRQLVPCSSARPSQTADLVAAYGEPADLDAFCFRAQLVNLQQYQALFEAAGAGMGTSYTGVLLWKSQNPWPGLRGSLYDWYLEQNGGLYGARRACQPVHVQLDLDDGSLRVVNTSAAAVSGQVSAVWLGTDGKQLGSTVTVAAAAAAGSTSGKLTAAPPAGLPAVYFLRLAFSDAAGTVLSRNVYWLSTAPPPSYAVLGALPKVAVDAASRVVLQGDDYVLTAKLSLAAAAPAVAFAVRLRLLRAGAASGSDPRVLPAFYADNYLLLLPGEERTVTVTCSVTAAGGSPPTLDVDGFNVA